MNVQVWQVTFQAVSSVAITCGLIYTALQFRHVRRAQHAANFSKLVELQMHLREMRVNDPILAGVYRKDLDQIGDARAIREYYFNLMQLSVFEIVWFGHKNGQIPADYFESWARRMEEIAAEESFQRMMATPSMKIMHDEFQDYVVELTRRASEAPHQDMARAASRN